jgi:hypothetical protein
MTFIPDLQPLSQGPDSEFFQMIEPSGHRLGYAGFTPGLTAYAVGWIGDTVESIGETPNRCIRALLDAYEAHHLFSDGSLGSHTCEVCPPTLPQRGYHHPFGWNGRQTTLYGHGHYLVHYGRTIFVSPALVLHYVVNHQYRPPDVFIDAVIKGRILTQADCEFIPENETTWQEAWRHLGRWFRLVRRRGSTGT